MEDGKKILIVDDMRTIQALLPAYLVGKFYEYEVASTGNEALAKMAAFEPDLVISDVNMPDMDGYELCRAIRSGPVSRKTPVILISGSVNFAEMEREGLAAGASAVLRKPLNADRLADTVKRVLGASADEEG